MAPRKPPVANLGWALAKDGAHILLVMGEKGIELDDVHALGRLIASLQQAHAFICPPLGKVPS